MKTIHKLFLTITALFLFALAGPILNGTSDPVRNGAKPLPFAAEQIAYCKADGQRCLEDAECCSNQCLIPERVCSSRK